MRTRYDRVYRYGMVPWLVRECRRELRLIRLFRQYLKVPSILSAYSAYRD